MRSLPNRRQRRDVDDGGKESQICVPTPDCPQDVSDNSAQDPFADELRMLKTDSPEKDMPSAVASSSTTSNTCRGWTDA